MNLIEFSFIFVLGLTSAFRQCYRFESYVVKRSLICGLLEHIKHILWRRIQLGKGRACMQPSHQPLQGWVANGSVWKARVVGRVGFWLITLGGFAFCKEVDILVELLWGWIFLASVHWFRVRPMLCGIPYSELDHFGWGSIQVWEVCVRILTLSLLCFSYVFVNSLRYIKLYFKTTTTRDDFVDRWKLGKLFFIQELRASFETFT